MSHHETAMGPHEFFTAFEANFDRFEPVGHYALGKRLPLRALCGAALTEPAMASSWFVCPACDSERRRLLSQRKMGGKTWERL